LKYVFIVFKYKLYYIYCFVLNFKYIQQQDKRKTRNKLRKKKDRYI